MTDSLSTELSLPEILEKLCTPGFLPGARMVQRSFADLTTLRIGGTPAAVVACSRPSALAGVVSLLDANSVPLLVVGGGSNLVIGEGDEVRKTVVVWATTEQVAVDAGAEESAAGLDSSGLDASGEAELFAADGDARGGITIDAESGLVRAFAGVNFDSLVQRTVEAGLSGLECLSGIPGSVGATPVQNVGAYGAEVSQVLSRVQLFDRGAEDLAAGADGAGLASEKENTPSYSTVLEQRAEVEDHAWSEQLADEVWGEFFAETSGTVPGFPVDLGAHGTTHPAAFVVTTLLNAEQMNSKVDAQPFPELLTAVARVLGRRVPMLIPMHTRGKNGSAAHSTVGWLVGNAPVVAEPEESPDTAKMWLRRAVAGQGLSIEKVLAHYKAEFPSATIFSASFVDFTKRGGAVPGASYISSRGPVDSVQMWFSRTETGIHLRMCYPDTHFAREFMPEFVNSLRAELTGRR